MKNILPVGKLKIDFLRSLLLQIDVSDTRVVIGPRIGEDATVIDFGEKYLVARLILLHLLPIILAGILSALIVTILPQWVLHQNGY